MLSFIKRNEYSYDVVHENGVHCGELEMEVDGYYVFWPVNRAGFWGAWFLMAVANKLDELNREWDQKVKDELCK